MTLDKTQRDAIKIAEALVEAWSVRAVGNTHAMLKGAISGAIVVTSNAADVHSRRKMLIDGADVDITWETMDNGLPGRLQGTCSPVVVDHAAMAGLLGALLEEISGPQTSLADLAAKPATMTAVVDTKGAQALIGEALAAVRVAVNEAVLEERRRCAAIARENKGSARRERHKKFGGMPQSLSASASCQILAEERGETIASGLIADRIEKGDAT